MTITGGHQIDALCHCLGEFRELTAFAVSQRDRIPLEGTGELVAKDTPDQLVVNGIVGDGAVVSFQIRGGMTRGTEFLFEIHGDRGDLVLTATTRASMQRQELTVRGAQGAAKDLAELPVPSRYRWVPDSMEQGLAIQCRPALRASGRQYSTRAHRPAQALPRRSPASIARRDCAGVGNRTEAGPLDNSIPGSVTIFFCQ